MAAPLGLARRLLLPVRLPERALKRSAFIATKQYDNGPQWIKVALTLGAAAALWRLLFVIHKRDLKEYERRQKALCEKCTDIQN
ncbi:NADH dehydrogenase [ubiquinone] 1 subunit C1, mitochondrial [Alligator mississippiensis]|uniref:NADH dehydrogenase [ubiquinone] 1 subunit C1, mitochondrial n=1 Tax=Alligator mississippiensis TaxID=8496 RepID=A0A151NHB4_ALLMI|nr:NADH dehydrogenase [ubiquinone] 1 subunit C1, mitochondrial [Alligator mississippiensis]KYO36144.1 NADH dehydrogenase [ubiquinone] 1 subunit C1, mitochondrial [Alligator mississippiensis]